MIHNILLFLYYTGYYSSAVAAGIVLGDSSDNRRSAARAAILDYLFGKCDPESTVMFVRRAAPQITILDRAYDLLIYVLSGNAAGLCVPGCRGCHLNNLRQCHKRLGTLRKTS